MLTQAAFYLSDIAPLRVCTPASQLRDDHLHWMLAAGRGRQCNSSDWRAVRYDPEVDLLSL
jgi:hypothetical protein